MPNTALCGRLRDLMVKAGTRWLRQIDKLSYPIFAPPPVALLLAAQRLFERRAYPEVDAARADVLAAVVADAAAVLGAPRPLRRRIAAEHLRAAVLAAEEVDRD
jgi:hypothetical protein